MALGVFIDGTDVSGIALTGSSSRRLNRISQGTLRFPMDSAIGGVGSRAKIVFDGDLHLHGRVMTTELDAGVS